MALSTSDYTAIVSDLQAIFTSSVLPVGEESKRYPWDVITKEAGNMIVVEAVGYHKEIPMKDSWLRGSWESRVRDAQREAFTTAWELEKKKNSINL